MYWLLALYLSIEILFYVAYITYMIPKANHLVDPLPFRDYGQDRCKLLLRILMRIEESCKISKADVKQTIVKFLSEWFHPTRNPLSNENADFPSLSQSPSSSPDNSDDDKSDVSQELPICLYKEDIDEFFAWAFFGKDFCTLLNWESKELDHIFQILENSHGLTFPSRKPNESGLFHYRTPRTMTLEPVKALHRPLLVYIIVYGIKTLGALFLYSQGFYRNVTQTGLVAWHRPARDTNNALLPLLFFHGIAPSGLVLYLPMVLYGLATEKDRPVFLFENRSISCAFDFAPLTEQETVDGVVEILQMFDSLDSDLSLVGHSFGSCPIAWLLASKRLPTIKQIVLLDPVAILLSEPDVMVNFLYAEELDKIRMIASSELFTEYYLRRHFAWYNSELWLEDVNCHLLVCLSEKDEIINAYKTKQEIERHALKDQFIFWEGVGHAACVTSPKMWKQVKSTMLQQELKIVQGR